MKRNGKPKRLEAQKHKEKKKISPEVYKKRRKKKKRSPNQKIEELSA